MNFFDSAHGEDFAVRFASELVSAMTCANRNRQGINAGFIDELFSLVRIGQQLIA